MVSRDNLEIKSMVQSLLKRPLPHKSKLNIQIKIKKSEKKGTFLKV